MTRWTTEQVRGRVRHSFDGFSPDGSDLGEDFDEWLAGYAAEQRASALDDAIAEARAGLAADHPAGYGYDAGSNVIAMLESRARAERTPADREASDPTLDEFSRHADSIEHIIAGTPTTATQVLAEMQQRLGDLAHTAGYRKLSECTEVPAAWCPLHGECTCDREESLDNPDCPLHSLDSDHAGSSADAAHH